MPMDGMSTHSTRVVYDSIIKSQSDLDVYILPATVPNTLDRDLSKLGMGNLHYSYPVKGQTKNDITTGLTLTGYNAVDTAKVYSCTVSHLRCWIECIELDQPIIVLEHDALFLRRFRYQDIEHIFKGGVLGLNNPLGATRRARDFHNQILHTYETREDKENKNMVMTTPTIDTMTVPQGIAGNSAYVIKPFAAKALVKKMKELGGWPNDALMCKQLFPWLQVVYPYYTKVQGTKSSTTT